MKIDPTIADRHWEQAAVEQLGNELAAQGFSTSRGQAFGNVRADLVATAPDGTMTIYEVKVPGRGRSPDWASRAAALRAEARNRGGRFKLVLVRLPHSVAVEVDGLEAALRDALIAAPPTELSHMSGSATVQGVEGIDLSDIKVRADPRLTELAGEATLIVALRQTSANVFEEADLPLRFRAVLDESNRIVALDEVHADLSTWDVDEGSG